MEERVPRYLTGVLETPLKQGLERNPGFGHVLALQQNVGELNKDNGILPMTVPTRAGQQMNIARPDCPPRGCGCTDSMHELANSINAVLINSQVLEWKLPPYSRLKRLAREIERHAQRSAALLQQWLEINESWQECCVPVAPRHGTMAAVAGQGPTAADEGPGNLPCHDPSPAAPGLAFPPERVLTSICDRCTSTIFPKEER